MRENGFRNLTNSKRAINTIFSSKFYALIAADVGMGLRNETQAELVKIRSKKYSQPAILVSHAPSQRGTASDPALPTS